GRFSWIAAVVLAICGVVAAGRAFNLARQEHRPRPFKASLAIGMAVLALLFSSASMAEGFPCRHKRTAPMPTQERECWKDHAGKDFRADLHDRMEQGREAATRRFM